MQKTYCDVCKQEIKQTGIDFAGKQGSVTFKVTSDLEGGSKDLCLDCVVKAINKEYGIKTKRKYTKPVKVTPVVIPNTDQV